MNGLVLMNKKTRIFCLNRSGIFVVCLGLGVLLLHRFIGQSAVEVGQKISLHLTSNLNQHDEALDRNRWARERSDCLLCGLRIEDIQLLQHSAHLVLALDAGDLEHTAEHRGEVEVVEEAGLCGGPYDKEAAALGRRPVHQYHQCLQDRVREARAQRRVLQQTL